MNQVENIGLPLREDSVSENRHPDNFRNERKSEKEVSSSFKETLYAVAEGQRRLNSLEAEELFLKAPLALLGDAAYRMTCRLHPEPWRTYNIDRNINYTNVCVCRCAFCAFSCDRNSPEAYVLTRDELYRKIEETIFLGGNQILLQGGLHPDLNLSWMITLLSDIKKHFPNINIHGLTPTEVVFFAEKEGISIRETLIRLRDAGLGSLPGGGAEILQDDVRRLVSPRKIRSAQWLEVQKIWHQMGMIGSATMMYGHLEKYAHRVAHLEAIRNLQDETHGFTAFIAWPFQPGKLNSYHPEEWKRLSLQHRTASETGITLPLKIPEMEYLPHTYAHEYLRTLAISRLYLDNIPNLQASWVTQGLRTAQLSLKFGANDMGSLMIEENVVASCGTTFHATLDELLCAISQMGYIPRRRNVFYHLI